MVIFVKNNVIKKKRKEKLTKTLKFNTALECSLKKHFNLSPFNSKRPKIEKTACLKTNKTTTTTIEIFIEIKP